jgi:plasmid maintenance system antidote protein VapI
MNKHIGSSLESLFDEAGEREEFEARVMKKMIVDEMRESMERRKITPPGLATQMRTSRAAVKRLLDPSNTGLTLDTLVRAAAVLGLSLSLKRKSARPAAHRERPRSAKNVRAPAKARASSRNHRRPLP